ncbi:atrial natriuretic peptide receptor 1-like [Argonauta hians]
MLKGSLKSIMHLIKLSGVKIILLAASENIQLDILKMAVKEKLSAIFGYQWVLFAEYSWQFPLFNETASKELYTYMQSFKGTLLFREFYNISGYDTPEWIRLYGKWYAADRRIYRGGSVSYKPNHVGARFGLAYDAVHLFAKAINILLRDKQTFTAKRINKILREIKIDGLTSEVKIDSNGNRHGYFGSLSQINVNGVEPFEQLVRYVIGTNPTTQIEIPFATEGTNQEVEMVLPNSKMLNVRHYWSKSGMIDPITQKLIRNPKESWPSVNIRRTEYIIAPYFCSKKCGKKILSPENIYNYDAGTCNLRNNCTCKKGYEGTNCEKIMCVCAHGYCEKPHRCRCHEGFTGTQCKTAICLSCVHGKCMRPYDCICDTWYYVGVACDIHLGSYLLYWHLIPCIILSLLISLSIKKYFAYSKKQDALANKEWIIDWSTVVPSDRNISNNNSFSRFQTYYWNKKKWHATFIDSCTVNEKDENIIFEMVKLVKLRHMNIITFGGACLVEPNVCLFTEYFDKGSLKDILEDEKFDLGWEFWFSFLRDICRGMEFIHENSEIKSHGRLKSSNCLIDNRWIVRISGFGAHSLRFGQYTNKDKEIINLKDLFWTAPEILRDISSLNEVKEGTPAGDVYSYAIITCEIITRKPPYHYELQYLSVENMLNLIRLESNKGIWRLWEDIGGEEKLYPRPILNQSYFSQFNSQNSIELFLIMIRECWDEIPHLRPNFTRIIKMLQEINPEKGELMDNLIRRLEQYSNSLEIIVIERTAELQNNKARAELLLSQMMPKKAAEELKKGRKIDPEQFDCVTISFSDIANFATVCEESTAIEIVDFLNELYFSFDIILDDYDVYKVETISDSYMVVSGLPERNGSRHASEIADMALDLMSMVRVFQIPHIPRATLQLRIGIHSGPVVSGVVGDLMPRYGLFGDTVNTASRMETSSYPLRIQVSETTASILEELGGYKMESRGKINVKGRGEMTAYWLWGNQVNKEQPHQSLAWSISKCKVK